MWPQLLVIIEHDPLLEQERYDLTEYASQSVRDAAKEARAAESAQAVAADLLYTASTDTFQEYLT